MSALDNVLRELGVGDVSVGKKMRKLGEALYGRMCTYEKALSDGDIEALKVAMARNIYETDDLSVADALARYAMDSHTKLTSQTIAEVERAPEWAQIVR